METILIVDDDKDMQFNLSNILKDARYEIIAVGDGRQAIKEVKKRSLNLVLLDIRLPDTDGINILKEIKKIDRDLIIIMLTAYGDVKGAVRAMKLGAFDYITKPFDNEELILITKRALQTQYLSKEVERLKKRLGEKTAIEEVMGESPQIKQVFNQVKIVAPTNMTVILQGESGTGKELIAQMIHQESPRRDKPFIAIDCAAIPETLVESELFGYEKGAFTGADDRKEGKFKQADGGTLVLDEVTNLSDATQMKLLRVIEERKLRRLGGKKDLKVDVRIVVITNKEISEAVRAGRFREDLFHRLNEFHIFLPPLRERKEDIPFLAKYFLDEANNEFAKKIKGFSAEAMEFLLNYHWPGNGRELRNVIRRAVLLTESDYIILSHLHTDITKPRTPASMHGVLGGEIDPAINSGSTLSEDEGTSFEDITKKVERDLIKKALEQANGNKVKAAKILRMNRKALYRKMERLGL